VKNYFTSLLIALVTVPVFSQHGSVTGSVVDGSTGQPVDFSVVALLSARDSSLVTGMMTGKGGKFSLQNVQEGKYILRFSLVGYNNRYIPVEITASKPEVHLGPVKLDISSVDLQTVTVTGEKPLIENKIDRKVFNVSESMMAATGTATDILKQVPSVSVDAEGNISLRGSENVVILINGKPSTISGENSAAILQQMPANMIENIEVITNPSAKYDPDGVTGIININLKKNVRMGTYGSVTFNAGTNNKYNGNVTLNYQVGKMNLSASYAGRYNEWSGWGNSWKESYLNDTTTASTRQHDVSTDIDYSHMGRLSMDYTFSEKTSAGYMGSFMQRHSTDLDEAWYNKEMMKVLADSSHNTNDEKGGGWNSDHTIYLVRKYDKKGQELRFNLSRSDSKGFHHTQFSQEHMVPLSYLAYQRDALEGRQALTTLQLDYTHPVTEKITLESGWKSIFGTQENDYRYDSLLNNVWKTDVNQTNHFIYHSQIHAAYATLKQEIGSFGYQVGLRGEYFGRQFELINTGENHAKTFWNLYPTVHLQQKLNESNEIMLSYSRRVFRPDPRSLNPFVHYYSPLTFAKGNPALNPEYVNSFEAGHTYKWEKNSISTTLYYRQTVNQITRMSMIVDTVKTMITSVNMNKSSAYGFDVNAIVYLARWWFINASSSVFNYRIDATNVNGVSKQKMNYSFKLISNIMVPRVINFQVSGFYRTGFITPQGEMSPFYSVDAGLRKDVLKGKGTIIFNVSDIFNTMRFSMKASDVTFSQEMVRKRESRVLYLGFTYRFGEPAQQSQQRQRQNRQQEENNHNNEGMMENVF